MSQIDERNKSILRKVTGLKLINLYLFSIIRERKKIECYLLDFWGAKLMGQVKNHLQGCIHRDATSRVKVVLFPLRSCQASSGVLCLILVITTEEKCRQTGECPKKSPKADPGEPDLWGNTEGPRSHANREDSWGTSALGSRTQRAATKRRVFLHKEPCRGDKSNEYQSHWERIFIGEATIHWNNLLRRFYKNSSSLPFPQKVGADDVFTSLPTWDTLWFY